MTDNMPDKTHHHPPALSNAQKKELRRLGHELTPLVTIGKEGLTDNVIEAIEAVLTSFELIKVKLLNTAPLDKQTAAVLIPSRTDSSLVQLIGKTLLLYRPNPKRPKDKRIKLV
ncbi:MAG: YhbY family RNA-binding protein [Desulfofustis sp.]|nr:YhbY family RNA-binding protein [Desulfofustis sp.]